MNLVVGTGLNGTASTLGDAQAGPMILTSNQRFGTWGKGLRNRIIATRSWTGSILHQAITVNIRGNSDNLPQGVVTSVKLREGPMPIVLS